MLSRTLVILITNLCSQIAFRLAKSGKKVLYISAKALESLPIEDDYDDALYRDILKNMIFSYSPTASDLIKYFMGMKQLPPRPDVVIVDFMHTFFSDLSALDTDDQLQKHFIECHMLMTVALHSTVDMLANNSPNQFISIICVDPEYHFIYQRFIQTLVDLYFYKEGCILSTAELLARFS